MRSVVEGRRDAKHHDPRTEPNATRLYGGSIVANGTGPSHVPAPPPFRISPWPRPLLMAAGQHHAQRRCEPPPPDHTPRLACAQGEGF